MAGKRRTESGTRPDRTMNMVVGVSAESGAAGMVTARMAGGLRDMKLPVSPVRKPAKVALQNMAKAINVALQYDFLQTELDCAYKAARVKKGHVVIQHRDYIGLGDGVSAGIGKLAKSFRLTLQGPDPASPDGKEWIERHGGGAVGGILNLLGRKLDLIQEYEDQVPIYVEQMFDRLEAVNIIVGWERSEWHIETKVVGLDVVLRPALSDAGQGA